MRGRERARSGAVICPRPDRAEGECAGSGGSAAGLDAWPGVRPSAAFDGSASQPEEPAGRGQAGVRAGPAALRPH